jgi:HEAT repeat protein
LEQVGVSPEALRSESGARALQKALGSSDVRAIAQAAALIAKHELRAEARALVDTYYGLASVRSHVDGGCLAKEALLQALEALDHGDADVFAHAATYEQYERVKGGTREIAARVRVAGVLGLARLGHGDLWCILGACLGDRDAAVRLAAAQAISHRGQRDGAGLLMLRLHASDDVPEIAIECLRGLFTLAPDHALRFAKRALEDHDSSQRERALHALGTANDDRAIELLANRLEQASLAPERERLIEALGLSRRARARELLLSIVRDGRPSDAEAAVSALAIHRYDARLLEQLEDAAAHSGELSTRVRELVASD